MTVNNRSGAIGGGGSGGGGVRDADDDHADESGDPVTWCLRSVRPQKHRDATWRSPAHTDGRQLCKFFMKGRDACYAGDACPHAHVPRAARRACWSWETYGVCQKELDYIKQGSGDKGGARGILTGVHTGVHTGVLYGQTCSEGGDDDSGDDCHQCWFPHPSSDFVDADLALQCHIGFSQRVVARCREIFGPDAVTATARADLSRNSETVVLIRAAGGAAAVARRLAAEDVHLLAQMKRMYAVSVRGTGMMTSTGGDNRGDDAKRDRNGVGASVSREHPEGRLVGAAATTVAGDTPRLLAHALADGLERVLAAAAAEVGGTLRVRVRGFPKSIECAAVSTLEAFMADTAAATKEGGVTHGVPTVSGDGDDIGGGGGIGARSEGKGASGDGGSDAEAECRPFSLELRSGRDVTHALDVVSVRNRVYIALWPTDAVAEVGVMPGGAPVHHGDAVSGGGGVSAYHGETAIEGSGGKLGLSPSLDTLSLTTAGAAAGTGDGHGHGETRGTGGGSAVYDGIEPCPSPPPPGRATLHELLYHCEKVKDYRQRQAAMCRAFFKLEEAVWRGKVPLGAGWQCVDVGASPGGWTQLLSARLFALRALNGSSGTGREGDSNRKGKGGGGPCGGDVSLSLSGSDGAFAVENVGMPKLIDEGHPESGPLSVDHGEASSARGHVWAIDPGSLSFDPALPTNVSHLRMKAEDAHGAIAADAALRGLSAPRLRLLVCDANIPPAGVAGILLSMTPMMARGGWLITTFKNFCKGAGEWQRQIEAAVGVLEEAGYTHARVFHLFSNCAQEKTLVAQYLPPSESAGAEKVEDY